MCMDLYINFVISEMYTRTHTWIKKSGFGCGCGCDLDYDCLCVCRITSIKVK